MTNDIKRTKDANSENFPVGSCLIPAKLRPHVMAFYDYARTADDVADSDLPRMEKLRRLDALEAVLRGLRDADEDTKCAETLRNSLEETGVTRRCVAVAGSPAAQSRRQRASTPDRGPDRHGARPARTTRLCPTPPDRLRRERQGARLLPPMR